MASRVSTVSKYGKLWGRGYENLKNRRILSVSGSSDHATNYLQGLVTSDLLSEPRAPKEEDQESINALAGLPPPSSSHSTLRDKAERIERSEPPELIEQEVPVKFTSKMRSTCFLDHRGRILTDAILWKRTFNSLDISVTNETRFNRIDPSIDTSKTITEYLIDVPSDTADLLWDHLRSHNLRRSKIKLADKSDDISVHAVYGTLNAEGAPPGFVAAVDPRHPSLGMRVLSVGPEAITDVSTDSQKNYESSNGSENIRNKRNIYFSNLMNNFFPHVPGTYSVLRTLSGIAEGSELTSRTALECNQEFLNAISFTKGCYLGQELTARSQFTGIVRKRIVPVMIINTEMELPRPWIMASMIQELGEENGMEKIFGLRNSGIDDNESNEEKKEMKWSGHFPSPLPKMSAAGAGSIVSMMMGSIAIPGGENPQGDVTAQEGVVELERLREAGAKLQSQIAELALPGVSIVDKKDGKIIGKVISSPAPGTTVFLAQMRLDRLGLLGTTEKWSRMNKVLIGDDSTEFRYLPYLPLWWPEIDTETGKEKASTSVMDEEKELE